MKTNSSFRKIAMASSLLIAVAATSCIDNTVSPQVEKIREAQVDWIKAQTAVTTALADMEKANIAYKQAETDALTKKTVFDQQMYAITLKNGQTESDALVKAKAFEDALNALKLKEQQAGIDKLVQENAYQAALNAFLLKDKENTVAYNLKQLELTYAANKASSDVAVANAQVALKTAEYNLNTALANLKALTAKVGTAEATQYYNEYAAQASKLTTLYAQKLTLQSDIAAAELSLTNKVELWKVDSTEYRRQLALKNAELTAQTAALTSLQTVNADPATINTEINKLTAANLTLDQQIAAKNTELQAANNAVATANSVYSKAQNTIATMEGYKSSRLTLTNVTIPNTDKLIAQRTEELSLAKSDSVDARYTLTVKTNDYNAKLKIYTAAKNEFETKYVAQYKDSLAAKDAAKLVLDNAASAKDQALFNLNQNPTSTTLKAAYDSAKSLYDKSLAAYNEAVKRYTNATNAMNNASLSNPASPYYIAYSNLTTAKSALTTAENNMLTKTNAAATALANLEDAKDGVTQNSLELKRLDAAIANLLSDYTKAVANYFQYAQDVVTANTTVSTITTAIAPLTAAKSQNNSLLTVYNSSLTNISAVKTAIESKNATIVTLKDDIEALNKTLREGASSARTNTQTMLANYKKQLEVVTNEITAAETIAAKWKTLLDNVFKA